MIPKTSITLLILIIPVLLAPSCRTKNNVNELAFNKKEIVPNRYNVAILIMNGVFNTELTAPYDIFHHTIFRDSIKPMNVFMVANSSTSIMTFEGLQIIPDFNYLKDSLPKIDVLVIPSAEHHMDRDLEDDKMLDFVRKMSLSAKFVASHCDGAFVLAKSGVLDGIESTTFPNDINAYQKMFPSLKVHENVLFVHDGKFITSAGGAKSFEASLYLCELLYGKKVADELAKGMVIDWDLSELKYFFIPEK
jgi:transcriptional regulator GlxA family with amidase domain